jgi:MFS family permease
MLVVLLLGQFMALVDVTIVNVAMPTIGKDMHASGSSLQLVVAGYTVCYAMLLITGARLGTLYGRRTMYLLGVSVFTLASLVCGVAPTSVVLIIARFVQGAAAAVMIPQIISVIQVRFSGKDRAVALSGYGVVLSAGGVFGLVLGGILVNANLFGYGWRPVFLVNVPIGLLVALLVPRLVPADEPRGDRKLDLIGLAIAVAAVFLVVFPLVLGHEVGWAPWTYVCIAIGLVLAVVFVPVEQRIAANGGDPLVRLDVFHSPGLGAGILTLTCSMIPYGGFLFVFALHLQSGLLDSALKAGLIFAPMSTVFGVVGFYWRKLPGAVRTMIAPISLGLCALAYVGLSLATRNGTQDSAMMWISLIVLGAALGAGVSPLITQSLTGVPMTKAADASGLVTTTLQLGQVVGVAAFGSIFLSLLHGPFTVHSSAHAMSTTSYWLALLAAVGLVPAVALARVVARAAAARG